MASFPNEHGIAAIGLRYHLNKEQMPQGMKMPPMVDVTHPETILGLFARSWPRILGVFV
jgi:hypothetical protein